MSILDFIWFGHQIPDEAIRLTELATKMLFVFGVAALVGVASAIYGTWLVRRERYKRSVDFFTIALVCLALSVPALTWVTMARAKYRLAWCHTSLECIWSAMNMYSNDYD